MKVLVVDDEEAGRAYLKALLIGHGHEVIEAEDGAEALDAARQSIPDVAVSDILMPVMDGYRLCLEWRKDEALHDIPFIFYTASYTDPADQDLAQNMGADRFVLKPADPNELMSVIESVVAERGPGRAVVQPAPEAHDETETLKEYSERLVSKLEEKVVELQESNRELTLAQELLAQEMEAKNDVIEQLHLDIEKRQRVEEALRRERDFTSHVIDVAELAIIGLDLQGRVELFSGGAERVTGFKASEVLGADWIETFVSPTARGYHKDHFDRLAEQGGSLRMTGIVRTRSGDERIVEWSDVVSAGPDGEAVGVIGFGLDVTERIRRDVSDTVLARLTDAVLFEETIDAAILEFCVRLAQTMRFGLVMLCVTEDGADLEPIAVAGELASGAPTVLDAMLQHAARSIATAETVVVDPSEIGALGVDGAGSAFVAPLSAFGETSGALVFVGSHPETFDPTLEALLASTAERTALVLLLAENQQQLRLQSAALNAAASAMVITDAEGVLVWANPSYEELTGRAVDADIGHPMDILRVEDGGQGRRGLSQALLEGRPFVAEIEALRADGVGYEELVTLDPVHDRAGEVSHFVVVRQDITERKRLEQLKSDFLSMVSHELRTPLTSIIGYTDLLLRDAHGDEEREREQLFAEKIRSHGGVMQGLIEELLEVSQMQTDPALRLGLRSVRFDQVVVQAAGSVLLDDRHELVLEVSEGVPDVVCDPDKIAHVVTNLVSNAAKYSPEGGPITVRLVAEDGTVRLSVEDTGIGIADADLDRIFERFTQADMSATREFGGFGLGLFIVQTIVDAHGGSVDVRSVPDRGSMFTVVLPILGPELASEEED